MNSVDIVCCIFWRLHNYNLVKNIRAICRLFCSILLINSSLMLCILIKLNMYNNQEQNSSNLLVSFCLFMVTNLYVT